VDIVVVEVVDTLTGLIVEVIEVNEETSRVSLLESLVLLAIKFKSPDFFVSLRSSYSTCKSLTPWSSKLAGAKMS